MCFRQTATLNKLLRTLIAVIFLLCSSAAIAGAQEATQSPPEHQIDLDLSSQSATASPTHLADGQTVNIQVGQTIEAISNTSHVTPAMLVAVHQVLSTGQQAIQLGPLGDAIGGSFNIGTYLSQHLSGLVIPQGVTATKDFGTVSSLNLSGNLVNNGTFFAASTNPAVTSAIINAANIMNNQQALLTSILPNAGLVGFNNQVNNLNLVLNAINNIINAGQITSSGSLTATAGGSIINALPSTLAGLSPALMQAVNNVNLSANNVLNSGIIASQTANINFISSMSSRLDVINSGGQLQALLGAINVRSTDYGKSISMIGGNFFSQELNLYADHGDINVDINKLSGTMNLTGNNIQATVRTGDVLLGRLIAYGDPLLKAATTYTITNDITTNGAPLSIVAGENIIDDGLAHQINTSAGGAAGGSVLLAAGTNWTEDATTLTFDGPNISGVGGYISLPNLSAFNSRGGTASALDFNGGNVTLVAYEGTAVNSGTITLPANLTITTGGSGNGSSGSFTAIAGADNLGAINSISLGSVNAIGSGLGPGGNIFIHTATPTGAVNIERLTGSITANNLAAGTSYANASVETGALLTSNSGNIAVLSGDNISTGADWVVTTENFTGANGYILLAAGISANSTTGSITVLSTTDALGPGATSNKTWHTVGVTTSPADFPVGVDLVNAIISGGRTPEQALVSAKQDVNSGVAIPEELILPAGTKLYKLVPQGSSVPNFSHFWFTEAVYQYLLANPNQIGNENALPASTTHATVWTGYEITAQTSVTVFKSVTVAAPITDVGIFENGGAEQILVPYRNIGGIPQWSSPLEIGTVNSPSPFVKTSSLYAGGAINLMARGNINVSGDSNSHSAIFGSSVLMCAGCVPIVSGGIVSVSSANASVTGGQISLFTNPSLAGPISSWGGNMSLIALQGTISPTPGSGTITTGSASSINSFATNPDTGLGTVGNILLVAGAANLAGANSISIGSLNANGGNVLTPSNIYIGTSTPSGGASLNLNTGSNSNSFAINNAAIQPASIATGRITSSGGNVLITAGANISTTNNFVDTNQTLGSGPGGLIDLKAMSGQISTAKISSLGSYGNGGAIGLLAGTTITTNDINSSGYLTLAGNISLSSAGALTVGYLNAHGFNNARGGNIDIYSGSNFTASLISTTTDGSGQSGYVSSQTSTFRITGIDASGASVNGTSSSGASNSITIKTTSSNPFVVGSAVGLNGIAGDILANGNSGGSIFLANAGGQQINSGRRLEATGILTGGRILFELATPGIGALIVINNGSVRATNTATNTNGRVAFNSGAGQGISITGTGTILGGEWVSLGNVDRSSLDLTWPPGGNVSISQTSVLNAIHLYVAPPESPELVLSAKFTFDVPLLASNGLPANFVNPVMLPTDATPIVAPKDAFSRSSEESDKDSPALAGSVTKTNVFGADTLAVIVEPNGSAIRDTSSNTIAFSNRTALFVASKDIVIRAPGMDIYAQAGSMVHVTANSSNVVIYNLHSDKTGAVQLVTGKSLVSLRMGKVAAIASGEVTTFEEASKDQLVSYRHPMAHKLNDGKTLFTADFSILSALSELSLPQSLTKCAYPHKDQVIKKLCKNAAITILMTRSSGAYTDRTTSKVSSNPHGG